MQRLREFPFSYGAYILFVDIISGHEGHQKQNMFPLLRNVEVLTMISSQSIEVIIIRQVKNQTFKLLTVRFIVGISPG